MRLYNYRESAPIEERVFEEIDQRVWLSACLFYLSIVLFFVSLICILLI